MTSYSGTIGRNGFWRNTIQLVYIHEEDKKKGERETRQHRDFGGSISRNVAVYTLRRSLTTPLSLLYVYIIQQRVRTQPRHLISRQQQGTIQVYRVTAALAAIQSVSSGASQSKRHTWHYPDSWRSGDRCDVIVLPIKLLFFLQTFFY